MPHATVFTKLVTLQFFPLIKTVEIQERTKICHNWGNKDATAGRAYTLTKKHLLKIIRRLKKALTQVYIISEGNYLKSIKIDIY